IEVRDSGAGIDYEKVRNLARERGFSAKTTEQLNELLLSNSFSTAESLSETSGRGEGLAAISSLVREDHGEIEIFNNEGKGTTLKISLPVETDRKSEIPVKMVG
ncbi:MAG: hypothetical protein KBD78_06255, partial [Oligoflexales bacterium]|nr:hypothetical protein [Oligoflexales bacterium]